VCVCARARALVFTSTTTIVASITYVVLEALKLFPERLSARCCTTGYAIWTPSPRFTLGRELSGIKMGGSYVANGVLLFLLSAILPIPLEVGPAYRVTTPLISHVRMISVEWMLNL
jgi:hypothetical protein